MPAAQAGGGLEGAAGMALRPELAAHAAALAQRLAEVAARPGATFSALLIGPRGAGKTLARPPAPLRGRTKGLAAVTCALLGAIQPGRRPGRALARTRSCPVRLCTSLQLGCSLHISLSHPPTLTLSLLNCSQRGPGGGARARAAGGRAERGPGAPGAGRRAPERRGARRGARRLPQHRAPAVLVRPLPAFDGT